MTDSITKILKDTRELLTDPSHRVRFTLAVDASGDDVDPRGPSAVAWCLLGALQRVSPTHPQFLVAVRHIQSCLSPGALIQIHAYSDHRSHEDILALLDRSILAARGAS